MELGPEDKEALELSLKVLAAPNISVAGGEYACRKYLAALDFLSHLKDRLFPEVEVKQDG